MTFLPQPLRVLGYRDVAPSWRAPLWGFTFCRCRHCVTARAPDPCTLQGSTSPHVCSPPTNPGHLRSLPLEARRGQSCGLAFPRGLLRTCAYVSLRFLWATAHFVSGAHGLLDGLLKDGPAIASFEHLSLRLPCQPAAAFHVREF